jgi:hypothetical protein
MQEIIKIDYCEQCKNYENCYFLLYIQLENSLNPKKLYNSAGNAGNGSILKDG